MSVRPLAFILAWSLLPSASSQDAAPPDLQKRITLEHRGKFKDFVERLRASLGVNIMVDRRTRDIIDPEVERELVLREVRGESALRWLTRLYNVDYGVYGDTVVIGRREHLHAPVLRNHEVRPLLAQARDSNGPFVSIPKGSSAGFFAVATSEVKSESRPEWIIDLIKEFVAPGTWEGAHTIELTPDQRLVVHHLPSVQNEVARFLSSFGALGAPMVTVSAEIVEADDASASLLRPGSSTMIAPADVAKVLEQLQGGRRSPTARAIQTTATATQRNHGLLMDEGSGLAGYSGKDPIVAQGIREVSVLDCRPIPVQGGKYISVEVRLALGQSAGPSLPLPTKVGELTFNEGTLTHVATTFLVPNGGAALFALPGRSASSKRGQLCLFRASTEAPAPAAAEAVREPSADAALQDRLAKAAPVSASFEEVPFDEFVKWLRSATGMNVVAHEDAKNLRVTLHGKKLKPAAVLPLVLHPDGLDYVVQDEAIYIAHRDRHRKATELLMLDVRDVAYGLQFFPGLEEEVPGQFTGEDLANLIKNTIRKDQWEEADGKTIVFEQGVLLIRNTPDMLRQCSKFVEDLRRNPLKIVSLRADVLTIPAAAADAILGRAGSDSHLIDEKQYEAISKAGTFLERLGWTSFESQQTTLSWERSHGYLVDWEGSVPMIDSYLTKSGLSLRPTLSADGRSVVLDLRYEDRRVLEVETKPVLDLVLQLPLASNVQAKTAVRIPNDRLALFKWSAPAKGAERQYRLLVLKPAPGEVR
jgi:hypothetical protein